MIYIICLQSCMHSSNALELLRKKKYNFKQKIITHEEKAGIKKKYNIVSFPYIFIKIKDREFIIGGHDKLKQYIGFIDDMKQKKIDENVIKYLSSPKSLLSKDM